MEFFRIGFELAEPVLVNRSVAFDGLLAHRTYLSTGDAEAAHRALPLAHVDGIWQASELLFVGPVATRKVHYVTNPRWDRFEYGDLADGRGRPRRKTHARDALKPTLDRYDAISARRAVAIGFGDVDGIEALVDGLESVGKKCRSGDFGRVQNVRIDRVNGAPQGFGYVDLEGQPVRVVPKGIWERLGLPVDNVSFGPARPRLPRWATDDEICALPRSHVIQPHERQRIGL